MAAAPTKISSLTETVYSAIITSDILRELQPRQVMREKLRQGPAGNSLVYQFPILDKPTGPSALTEGAADLWGFGTGETEVTTSQAQVTAGQIAQKATVTKLVSVVSVINAIAEVKGVLTRGFGTKFETDATALLAGFSNVSGGGVAADVPTFLGALAAIEARDVDGTLVFVGHTKQVGDLRTDIVTSGGDYFNQGANAGDVDGIHQSGMAGTLFGVPMWYNSTVSSSGGNYRGAIFASKEALGLYELWGVTGELDWVPTALSTDVVVSQCYGVGEISDTRGQGVYSSTT